MNQIVPVQPVLGDEGTTLQNTRHLLTLSLNSALTHINQINRIAPSSIGKELSMTISNYLRLDAQGFVNMLAISPSTPRLSVAFQSIQSDPAMIMQVQDEWGPELVTIDRLAKGRMDPTIIYRLLGAGFAFMGQPVFKAWYNIESDEHIRVLAPWNEGVMKDNAESIIRHKLKHTWSTAGYRYYEIQGNTGTMGPYFDFLFYNDYPKHMLTGSVIMTDNYVLTDEGVGYLGRGCLGTGDVTEGYWDTLEKGSVWPVEWTAPGMGEWDRLRWTKVTNWDKTMKLDHDCTLIFNRTVETWRGFIGQYNLLISLGFIPSDPVSRLIYMASNLHFVRLGTTQLDGQIDGNKHTVELCSGMAMEIVASTTISDSTLREILNDPDELIAGGVMHALGVSSSDPETKLLVKALKWATNILPPLEKARYQQRSMRLTTLATEWRGFKRSVIQFTYDGFRSQVVTEWKKYSKSDSMDDENMMESLAQSLYRRVHTKEELASGMTICNNCLVYFHDGKIMLFDKEEGLAWHSISCYFDWLQGQCSIELYPMLSSLFTKSNCNVICM